MLQELLRIIITIFILIRGAGQFDNRATCTSLVFKVLGPLINLAIGFHKLLLGKHPSSELLKQHVLLLEVSLSRRNAEVELGSTTLNQSISDNTINDKKNALEITSKKLFNTLSLVLARAIC